jgi:peptide/nickel transport system ATP-binding protein
MIVLENVVAGYRTSRGLVKAVDNVSLTVEDGEILGIAGESGCGKTTLLKLLYGRFDDGLELFEGRVYWRSRDGSKTIDCGDFCKHWWDLFSYVPQGSMSAMNPLMKIAPQMLDAGSATRKPDGPERLDRIRQTIADLDLPDRTLGTYPHQLSGGMRQRVLIGLASHVDPSVILADEPTTALDVVVQRQILEMIVRLQRKQGNTVVIVSHDLGLHYQITHRVAVLYAGRLAEIGPTDTVLREPSHPYTRGLVDALPRLGDRTPRNGIEGRPPDFAALPPGCRFAPRCAFRHDRCHQIDPDPISVTHVHAAACVLVEEKAA